MAKNDKAAPILPGDLVQVTQTGNAWFPCIGLVREVRKRGVGVDFLAIDKSAPDLIGVSYQRFDNAAVTVVGAAAVLPADIQRARADAVETARLIEKETK